ncbi:MAG: ribonuclease HI family protein [Spirochaetes bacterium]|jgi:ribonuclease HI|nr:ribonuclease HI family protein [Spirochaetota bacterium]
MLLSIDRVLQLITEDKSLDKIAEMAECSKSDVIAVLENARNLLSKHEKAVTKRKVIIKKIDTGSFDSPADETRDIFRDADLTAVPVDSSLTIYTDGASKGNPGPAGIGIVIYDTDDRQVGKVSSYIGKRTNNFAEYTALIRALKIAVYFNTKNLKLRTDSELIVKQINGDYKVKNETIKTLYEEAIGYIRQIKNFKIEHVTRNLNEKADYYANKGIASVS